MIQRKRNKTWPLRDGKGVLTIISLSIIMLFFLLAFLFLYFEKLEDNCWLYANSVTENPDELIEISSQERIRLGIDAGLVPTKRYYEQQKCIKERSIF